MCIRDRPETINVVHALQRACGLLNTQQARNAPETDGGIVKPRILFNRRGVAQHQDFRLSGDCSVDRRGTDRRPVVTTIRIVRLPMEMHRLVGIQPCPMPTFLEYGWSIGYSYRSELHQQVG